MLGNFGKKIIKIHNDNDEDNLNYSIEFLDLKSFYLNNILNSNSTSKQEHTENFLETENQDIRNMFIEINNIFKKERYSKLYCNLIVSL